MSAWHQPTHVHPPRMAEGGMPKVTPSPCPGTGSELCSGMAEIQGVECLLAVVSSRHRQRASAAAAAAAGSCAAGRLQHSVRLGLAAPALPVVMQALPCVQGPGCGSCHSHCRRCAR